MPADRRFLHPDIGRLREKLSQREPLLFPDEAMRRAAVALILRPGSADEPELLFIKRAEYQGDPWSGQIAFPGGRREAHDESLEQTAFREIREELGVDLGDHGEILGMLDELQPQSVRLPAIVVCPFVVVVDDLPALTLSSEVAGAFWLPLKALRDPASWRETEVTAARGVRLTRRAYAHEGNVIWGITERIIAQLIELLEGE